MADLDVIGHAPGDGAVFIVPIIFLSENVSIGIVSGERNDGPARSGRRLQGFHYVLVKFFCVDDVQAISEQAALL